MIAILGTLIGLLLPALHGVRESARRTGCTNNVRQCGLGTLAYEAARRSFPPGCDLTPRGPNLPDGTQHAWSTFILPYIEQEGVAARIDLRQLWNASNGNDAASDTSIPMYVCPGGVVSAVGKADYGGVSGVWIMADGVPFLGAAGLASGMLVSVDGIIEPVRAGSVSDGLSSTLLVAEAVDRRESGDAADVADASGRWAWINCFAQAAAFVNARGSDIRSHHPSGALGGFADGHVAFLDESLDPAVLSAVCTRNGGEASASTASLH